MKRMIYICTDEHAGLSIVLILLYQQACEDFAPIPPQGVHLGGREPGDSQCDSSR